MAVKRFVTDQYGGLDSQRAPHLLPPGGLQTAENVDFSEHGSVSSLTNDYHLIQSISGGSLYGAGWAEIDGVSYYIYKAKPSGYVVYAYNVSTASTTAVSTSGWGSGTLQVIQANDLVILTDGTKNAIWDGTVLYGFGAPIMSNGSLSSGIYVSPVEGVAITSISVEADSAVRVTDNAHGLETGDRLYIDGVEDGLTGLNGKVFTVADYDTNWFELADIDGDQLEGTATVTNAYYYPNACGLAAGDYRYYVGTAVTLPSDEVITGSPQPIYDGNSGSELVHTLTIAPTDKIYIFLRGYDPDDISDWVSGTYTVGTDLTVAARVYRSKLGDTSVGYLDSEVAHANIYDTTYSYYEHAVDNALGAQYLGGSPSGFDSHDAPDTFSVGAMHAYRLYVGIGNELYWSNTDGPGYFKPTSSVPVDEEITAIESVGDFVVVFGKYGVWLWDPVNQAMKSLRMRRGVDDFRGVEQFDGRVWYANDLGLYYLDTAQLGGFSVDAVQSKPVSWPVDDEWQALDGDWSLGSTHDRLYINCKQTSSSKTFVLHVGDGAKMSTFSPGVTVAHGLISDKNNNRCLYHVASGGIYAIGEGSGGHAMTVKGPAYMSKRGKAQVLKADVSAQASFTATVTTNQGESSEVSIAGGTGRSIVYAELTQPVGEIFEVQFVGTGTLYGHGLAVEELYGEGF